VKKKDLHKKLAWFCQKKKM